jgi:hypothetical protein
MIELVAVQPQCAGECVNHLITWPGLFAPFEPDVLVAADAGQGGELFTPRPWGPPRTMMAGKAYVGGSDLGPPSTQEVAQLGPDTARRPIAAHNARMAAESGDGAAEGGPATPPNSRDSHLRSGLDHSRKGSLAQRP